MKNNIITPTLVRITEYYIVNGVLPRFIEVNTRDWADNTRHSLDMFTIRILGGVPVIVIDTAEGVTLVD